MNIEYFEKVKKQYPFRNHKIKNCSIAFISGGIIGGIGQGFLYLYLDIMKMVLNFMKRVDIILEC